MPYAYGRRYRRRSRSTRRYRRRSTYKRRFKRVRRYRRRGTVSSVVKLTQDAVWDLNNQGTPPTWNAFSFSPLSLPGFSDYSTTYSHFRIIKAKLFISRTIGDNDGSLYNYLVVGSRPFAATTRNDNDDVDLVPAQKEDDLRQTKWQRVHYPSTTTQRVTAGFYPYTMIGTAGPVGVGNSNAYWYRIWEAKRWMPFKWANHWTTKVPGTNVPLPVNSGIAFYGPYLVVDTNKGELPVPPAGTRVQCTLQLHVQFKGQR